MRKRIGICSIEDARSVTVTVEHACGHADYRSLSDPQLLDEIRQCVGNVGFSREQMTREMRKRLLPALLELRKRTYRRKPGFYETLANIGLNAATVRQWFYRSNTGDEIIGMLEEVRPKNSGGKRESDNVEELLLAHGLTLAVAVLRNQSTHSRKLRSS